MRFTCIIFFSFLILGFTQNLIACHLSEMTLDGVTELSNNQYQIDVTFCAGAGQGINESGGMNSTITFAFVMHGNNISFSSYPNTLISPQTGANYDAFLYDPVSLVYDYTTSSNSYLDYWACIWCPLPIESVCQSASFITNGLPDSIQVLGMEGSGNLFAGCMDSDMWVYPSTETNCTQNLIDDENFESNWGIWNDGGSDCRRNFKDAAFANSGDYCVRLRDNTNSSVMTTDILDLQNYEEVTIDFSYITKSMDNTSEDFWLQISTDGGASYVTLEEWNRGDEFENNIRHNESVIISGPFTDQVRFRFRCDASGNNDKVYIDDVVLSGCLQPSNARLSSPNEVVSKIGKEDNSIIIEKHRLEETQDISLNLYPNPVSHQLTIDFQIEEEMDARLDYYIINSRGNIVFHQSATIQSQKQIIDISSIPTGYYFLRVVSDKFSMTEKFVVIK